MCLIFTSLRDLKIVENNCKPTKIVLLLIYYTATEKRITVFKIFRYDGPFSQFMIKLCDCMLLSLLWVISSLPVVTVGASTSALYACAVKVLRKEEGGVWKTYWSSFKSSFKQATLIGVPILLACVFWGLTLETMARNHQGDQPLYTVAFVLLAVGIIWLHYIFAYIARFNDTVRNMLRTTFIIALANFPFSLLLLFVFAVAALGLWISLPASSISIIIAPAVYMLFTSLVLERIFKKYMPADEEASLEAL